jgi:hypothetical protein
MIKAVTLPEPVEAQVRFVEDTAPGDIVGATVARLRAGASPRELVRAAVLAVSRSTELPRDHHGGPVHPVCGAYSILDAAARLEGDWALMPTVHAVALANKHVHSPLMGPYIMPELAAAEANGGDDSLAEEFAVAIRELRPSLAERMLLRLLQTRTPAAVLDLMLPIAIRRNPFDDHYLLYPIFAARTLDAIGWEWAPIVLRPVVRYLASNVRGLPHPDSVGYTTREIAEGMSAYNEFDGGRGLIAVHGLDVAEIAVTGEAHGESAGALGERFGGCDDFSKIPGMLAEALAQGMSLETAGEALSIGAALLYLRSDYGNPFDVHLLTGANARRYLISLEGVSTRNKICALLSWATGSEVRGSEAKLAWPVRQPTADLPRRGAGETLEALSDLIAVRPGARLFEEARQEVTEVVAGDQIREIQTLAQAYVEAGYDSAALQRRMSEIVCRDDFTEMHAFKFQAAAAEERTKVPEPYRWAYLVAAAREAAVSHGLSETVYTEAKRHLAI